MNSVVIWLPVSFNLVEAVFFNLTVVFLVEFLR